jgi:hypothetical protein
MKLLFHLVRADVRRFRLLLAAWVLIEIFNTVFTGVQPLLTADPKMLTAVGLLGTVLFLTRWLGMIVIVALVVQTHPLVGSDAFWMTRPIPPRALFASKILLLGTTFIALPALCELALMAACGIPIAEAVLVTLQTILFQSLWLAIVMALSAVTRNLARFALAGGGVLASLVLLFSIMIAVAMRNMPDGPQLGVVTNRSVSSPTAGVVMLLLLITAAVVLLVVQYRTRSTRVSVGAGVAGVAVVILVALMWPSHPRPLPVPEWASRESALRLVAESPKGEFSPEHWSPWGRSEGWRIGRARLRLSGVEEGWLATVRLAGSTVQFDDGVTLATAGNGYQEPVPFESVDDFPSRVALRRVLGVGRVSGGSYGNLLEVGVPAIVVSQADFKKYSGATGTYRGRFLVDLDRLEIAATRPLQTGAEYRDRGYRLVIDQVIAQTESASIRVRRYTSSTMFQSDRIPPLSFYLRNRVAAEAVAGSSSGSMGGMSTGLALPFMLGFHAASGGPGNGFSATGDYIRFPDYNPKVDDVNISPDWLSHAELVIVRTVQWGSVTRTVEIPGYEIRAAPPTPSR